MPAEVDRNACFTGPQGEFLDKENIDARAVEVPEQMLSFPLSD
jgi:hypothetical protein